MFPSTSNIYGVDLSPVPPVTTDEEARPNMKFIVGDIRELMGSANESRLQYGTADFVFNRLLLCGMTDWPRYAREVFAMLKPGGWAEMQDFEDNFYSFNDPASGPAVKDEADSTDFKEGWEWLGIYRQGARDKGIDISCGKNIQKYLLDAGFVDVKAREFKAPYWRDAAKTLGPQVKETADMLIGDRDGYFWHAVPRLVEDMEVWNSKEKIEMLREQMMKSLQEQDGKYQFFWSTVGRKPAV